MKTSLFFFSFLLVALSSKPFPIALALDPVLDTNGDALQAGNGYYALPIFWGRGGGLTLVSNINGTLCPLSVVQSRWDVDHGRPLLFTPILLNDEVIRVSTSLDIEFPPGPTFCFESFVWQVQGPFVVTGGVKGSVIRNFEIRKVRDLPALGPTYKFVYCVGRMVCQDIGITQVNGEIPLTVLAEPYEIIFVKAETLQIKKITAARKSLINIKD